MANFESPKHLASYLVYLDNHPVSRKIYVPIYFEFKSKRILTFRKNIWNILLGRKLIQLFEDFPYVLCVKCYIKTTSSQNHTQIFIDGGMDKLQTIIVLVEKNYLISFIESQIISYSYSVLILIICKIKEIFIKPNLSNVLPHHIAISHRAMA